VPVSQQPFARAATVGILGFQPIEP
jgi:hypothetical protein